MKKSSFLKDSFKILSIACLAGTSIITIIQIYTEKSILDYHAMVIIYLLTIYSIISLNNDVCLLSKKSLSKVLATIALITNACWLVLEIIFILDLFNCGDNYLHVDGCNIEVYNIFNKFATSAIVLSGATTLAANFNNFEKDGTTFKIAQKLFVIATLAVGASLIVVFWLDSRSIMNILTFISNNYKIFASLGIIVGFCGTFSFIMSRQEQDYLDIKFANPDTPINVATPAAKNNQELDIDKDIPKIVPTENIPVTGLADGAVSSTTAADSIDIKIIEKPDENPYEGPEPLVENPSETSTESPSSDPESPQPTSEQ